MRDIFDKADLSARFGPKLAGYHWESGFAFLFFTEPFDLGPFFSQSPGLELRQVHELRYDQWQDGAEAAPFRVGPIVVIPSQDGLPGPALSSLAGDLPPIYIDPGLAFGYGGHPTTKACLEFLVRVYHPNNGQSHPRSVLDLGTGTGILALAALRLGAQNALGVDYSHLAAKAAQNNLRLNTFPGEKEIRFLWGQAADHAFCPGSLVMANIPLAVHLELLEKGAYRRRRYLIVSGLLPAEAEDLWTRLSQSLPLKILDSQRDDRWSSYLLENPENMDPGL
jgi:ribosomal protein L11 methyltransferase